MRRTWPSYHTPVQARRSATVWAPRSTVHPVTGQDKFLLETRLDRCRECHPAGDPGAAGGTDTLEAAPISHWLLGHTTMAEARGYSRRRWHLELSRLGGVSGTLPGAGWRPHSGAAMGSACMLIPSRGSFRSCTSRTVSYTEKKNSAFPGCPPAGSGSDGTRALV